MRVFGRTVLLVAVLLMAAAPARAGSEQAPEMSDECSGYVHSVEGNTRVRHPSLDLCKGWFTSATGPTGAPVLQLTLQVNSAPADGISGLYVSYWRSGDCTYAITIDNALNSPHPQAFSADCEPPGEQTCAVPQLQLHCTVDDTTRYFALPAGSVAWNDDRLQVTVSFDGELAPFAADHAGGAVLTGPTAVSAQAVGPVHGWTAGCSTFLAGRCFEANGDWMYPARDYTVSL